MSQNQKKFEQVRRLGLPAGHYLISGSGPMGVRNLRDIRDIDLAVSSELWNELAEKYGIVEEKGIKKIVIGDLDIEAFGDDSFPVSEGPSVEERLAEAEVIDGLPFESIGNVLMYKRMQGREKDLQDIELLERWITKTG